MHTAPSLSPDLLPPAFPLSAGPRRRAHLVHQWWRP